MNPLISIIVPIYNVENYLDRSIESIRNQSYRNIEIILVNDGSTDNSLIICEKYAALDERIIVINQENAGVSNARNNGLKYASGKYIGFIDPDDWIEFNMYEELLKSAQSNKSDIVMCEYVMHEVNNKSYNVHFNIEVPTILTKEEIRQSIIKNMLGPQNLNRGTQSILGSVCRVLINKDIIRKNKIKFSKEVSLMEDLIFMVEVLLLTEKVTLVKSTFYHYEMRNLSAVNKFRSTFFEENLFVYQYLESILNKSGYIKDFEEIMKNRYVTLYLSSFENLMSIMNPTTNKVKIHKIKEYCSDYKLLSILNELNYKNFIIRKKILFNFIVNNNSFGLFIYYKMLNKLKYKKIL